MKTSDNGLTMIMQFEGLRLSAYQDGVGVWTIGYGTTQNVRPGMVITLQQAVQRLRDPLVAIESFISAVVTPVINQDMFDALVSFTYNVGQGNLRKSSVLRLLNIGDFYSAADGFLLWTKAGGLVIPGLVHRRAMERAVFLLGVGKLSVQVVQNTPEPPLERMMRKAPPPSPPPRWPHRRHNRNCHILNQPSHWCRWPTRRRQRPYRPNTRRQPS
jgi:lysozyme